MNTYLSDLHPGREFRITSMGGYFFTLSDNEGTVSVPIKNVELIDNNKEESNMGNPTNCTKASLLLAVDDLNANCVTGNKLRITSKSIQIICDTVADATTQMNHNSIVEDCKEETVAELIAWGIISADFLGDEDVPDGLQKVLDAVDDKTTQAASMTSYDESTTQVQEDNQPQVNEDEDKGEDLVEVYKADIKELTDKLAKATEKGKKKKIKKFTEELDTAKGNLMALKASTKKKEEPKVNPRVAEIEAEIKELNEAIEAGMKKKKAKKANAKLTALATELAELPSTKPVPKKKKAGKKRSGPGVILTIRSVLEDSGKWMDKDEILEAMQVVIPGLNMDTAPKTLRAQLFCRETPCRLEKEKGCVVEMKGEKDERKFRIKS